MTVGPATDISTLLFDDFSGSGPASSSTWDYNHFSSGGSYYGRIQQRQELPSASGGLLDLQLDTFNPTGFSLYGSELISNQSFDLSNGGISVEFSARLRSATPGLVE